MPITRSSSARLASGWGPSLRPLNYPPRLSDWFSMDLDYPSIQPPDYLRQLSPELYEQECRRGTGSLREAVQLAERAFMDDFARMVKKLCRQISGEQGPSALL